MFTFLQIIGTDTGDSTPSFMLVFDKRRYLFNCGEGFQRLATESATRLAKVESVFLTRLRWRQCGGLPGLLLTLAGVGRTFVNVHGPTNLHHFWHSTRRFMGTGKLAVNVHEYGTHIEDDKNNCVHDADVYKDEFITISPICIRPETAEMPSRKRCRKDDAQIDGRRDSITKRTRDIMLSHLDGGYNRYSQKQHDSVPPPRTDALDQVLCYVCELSSPPPKFDAKKAVELNIPKGDVRAKLVRGQTVTLDDGRTITPDMVTGTTQRGHVTLVIDCPGLDYISDLVEPSKWKELCCDSTESSKTPILLIHMASNEVLTDDRYVRWASAFGITAEHIFINSELCSQSVIFKSQARAQAKLNVVDENIFAPPCESHVNVKDALSLLKQPLYTNQGRVAEPMLRYQLLPKKRAGFLESESDTHQTPHEMKKVAQQLLADHAYDGVDEKSKKSHEFPHTDKNVEIVFLGTGSAIPSKYRNVSSSAVRIPGHGTVLMDAGEGTYGQIRRLIGRSKIQEYIDKIRCAYISHMHADHHLGLIRILSMRSETAVPLLIVGPLQYKKWLDDYSALEPLRYSFVSTNSLYPKAASGTSLYSSADEHLMVTLRKELGIQLQCVPVIHTKEATGIVIEHESGWKVVYSGDTRPCKELTRAGKNATVLIHEATFEEDMLEEAISKNHSTTLEAVQEGVEMNAGLIVLNHFSQRYPKVPKIDANFTDRTTISFDLMRFGFKDIPKLPEMMNKLKAVFSEEEAELHDSENETPQISVNSLRGTE
eukprot:CFRG4945T1